MNAPETTKNPNLVRLARLSDVAARKLPTILRYGAIALRDTILDETLNRHAERHGATAYDAMALEASGALNAACEIAARLGAAYQGAHLTRFGLQDWYRACGLDKNGELHDGLFDTEIL